MQANVTRGNTVKLQLYKHFESVGDKSTKIFWRPTGLAKIFFTYLILLLELRKSNFVLIHNLLSLAGSNEY